MPTLPEIEAAIAEEAAAHARAALELNPFGDAEAAELGNARLVYAGAFSPVHGVYALGLDGPPDERDWGEIERFFLRKEREPNFWTTPFTDPSVEESIRRSHHPVFARKVSGWAQLNPGEAAVPSGSSYAGPDHSAWCLAFSRQVDPGAKEPNLLSFTKLHQKNTRYYLEGNEASYTFFHRGIALVPFASPALLERQKSEAEAFRSAAFIVMGEGAPLLYERILHEPV